MGCRFNARPLAAMAAVMLMVATAVSCRKTDQAQLAGTAAKCYYEYLVKGEYGNFVDGMYNAGNVPQAYHDQMVANTKMFVRQLEKRRSPLLAVDLDSAAYDEASQTAQAFIVLVYSDSTTERIMVPMVRDDGVWVMR